MELGPAIALLYGWMLSKVRTETALYHLRTLFGIIKEQDIPRETRELMKHETVNKIIQNDDAESMQALLDDFKKGLPDA